MATFITLWWYWNWLVLPILLAYISLRVCIWLVFLAIGRIFRCTITVSGFKLISIAEVHFSTPETDIAIRNVRVMFAACRSGFVSVNVKNIIVRVQSLSKNSTGTKSTRSNLLRRTNRLLLTLLKLLLKIFQLSIDKLLIELHAMKSPSLGYYDCVKVHGLVLKRSPVYNSLGVILEVYKLKCSSWVCFDKEINLSHRLVDIETSFIVNVLVKYIIPSNGEWLESIQWTVPSINVALEAVTAGHLVNRFTARSSNNPDDSPVARQPTPSKVHPSIKKMEGVVESSCIKYLSSTDNRYLMFGTNKVSLAMSSSPSFLDMSTSIKDFIIKGSSDQQELQQLNQIQVNLKRPEDNTLNITVNLSSVKTHLDSKCIEWINQLLLIKPSLPSQSSESTNGGTDSRQPRLPSIVITVNISDWLMNVSFPHPIMDPPIFQLVVSDSTVRLHNTITDTTNRSVSVRVRDSYIYVPSEDGMKDDTSILPINDIHHRGRVLSIGILTADIKKVTDIVDIKVKGQCWNIDWSEKMLKLLPVIETVLSNRKAKNTSEASTIAYQLPELAVEISIDGVNLFMTACPRPCVTQQQYWGLMCRVDCIHYTMKTGETDLVLYKLGVDQIMVDKDVATMPCYCVDNLPSGGIAYLQQLAVNISNTKIINFTSSNIVIDWTPSVQMLLVSTIKTLQQHTAKVKGSLFAKTETSKQSNVHESVGAMLSSVLDRNPYTVNVDIDEGKLNCSLTTRKNKEVCLSMLTCHSTIKQTVSLDVYEIKLIFDKNPIVTVEGLQGGFPMDNKQERQGFDNIHIQDNSSIALMAQRVEIYLPDNYKFYVTYEKLMNIRKFVVSSLKSAVQPVGGANDATSVGSVLLPLDVVVDIDELVFQIEDNQMEVKLKANYELMTDELEQRLLRESALQQELEVIKKNQGRLFSVKLSQNLKDSLVKTNAEIYCKRARELYCNEPLPTELMTINLSQLKLTLMTDSSLIGTTNLIHHINQIDSQSQLPKDYCFSTIWGIYTAGSTKHIEISLRDYPWKLLDGKSIDLHGKLVCAEQEAHHHRECYSCPIDVDPLWQESPSVTRKLPPLKFYHDFKIKSTGLEVSWGPCLDPSFAQINYAFSLLTKPSLDPSPPLPWWDKFRLLIHGNTELYSPQLSVNLLTSPNPYNDAEFLDLQFIETTISLENNVSLLIQGGLEAFVYTASRYNKCHILQLPSVGIDIQFHFATIGDDSNTKYTHHCVTRCLHDKLPESATGQEHDSYRSFRSQSMSFDISLDVKQAKEPPTPNLLIYASTLRWLQNALDFIRSSISRPIRKGKVHENVRPKKKRFTRHIKEISLSVQFPETVIHYWSSVARVQGLTVELKDCVVNLKQVLCLVPYEDGLIRRPQPQWSIKHCSSTINKIAVYACSNKQTQKGSNSASSNDTTDHCFEKRMFVLLSKLSYQRIDDVIDSNKQSMDFKHQLKTNDTKIVWSEFNRDIIYKLLNSFNLYKRLKRDLSSDALKSVFSKLNQPSASSAAVSKDDEETDKDSSEATRRHGRLRRHNSGCVMLDQLLSDICNTLVTSEETRDSSDPKLSGIVAANSPDVEHLDWFIELLHTQLALHGVERKGWVVCSSYVTQVFGREHNPRLRGGDLVSKKSWIAKVQDLQYFCSIHPTQSEYIPWLPSSTVESPGVVSPSTAQQHPDPEMLTSLLLSQLGPDVAHPIGAQSILGTRPPGESVGGLVTSVPLLGVSYDEDSPITSVSGPSTTVQRIASRCHCQMFYVSYGDPTSGEDNLATQSQPATDSNCVDTFTFRYPSSEVATTSFQYLLIMDVVNNLLLYKEPRKKESTEQHARQKFMLQLTSLSEEDIKKPITAKQNKLRQILATLKTIENDLYVQYSTTDSNDIENNKELKRLEEELSFGKEDLLQSSVELRAMIRAFKESQLSNSPLPANNDVSAEATRRIEIWLDDSKWSLMHNDGQLQVSDIHFTNVSYNRISYSDDSGEHRFELGSFRVKNCMPNTPPMYQEVLSPYDPASRRLRVDKNVSLRIYCRDQSPVAGISVTEHLELNVVPLSVKMTGRFYNTLQEFFLPKAEAEASELSGSNQPSQHANVLGVQPTYTSSVSDHTDGMALSKVGHTKSVSTPPPSAKEAKKSTKKFSNEKIDDVEIMKNRASEVKTFIYVKLPQTSLCITYKGEGIASVKEIVDKIVTIQTIEYHNLNMSWRALLLEIKKDYKNSIISQILKSAIGFKETDEKAGLSSPKLGRSTSDILLGKVKEGKSKTKKVFMKSDDHGSSDSDTTAQYNPPLSGERQLSKLLHNRTSSHKNGNNN